MQEPQEIRVRFLGREDPLEEGMATYSIILACNPMNRGAWWTAVHVVAKNGTRLERLSTHTCAHTHEKITIGTNVSVAEVSDTQLDTAGYFPRTASGKRGVSARVYEVGKAEKPTGVVEELELGSLFPCLASHGLCNLGEFP